MSTKMNAPIEIRLLGQRIPLKASADEPQRVQEVIDLVAGRILKAEGRVRPGAQPQQVAVLALLDLAEDYLKAKQAFENHQQEISTRTEELLTLLGPE